MITDTFFLSVINLGYKSVQHLLFNNLSYNLESSYKIMGKLGVYSIKSSRSLDNKSHRQKEAVTKANILTWKELVLTVIRKTRPVPPCHPIQLSTSL